MIDPLRGTIAGALILIGLGLLLIPVGIKGVKVIRVKRRTDESQES